MDFATDPWTVAQFKQIIEDAEAAITAIQASCDHDFEEDRRGGSPVLGTCKKCGKWSGLILRH